MVNDKGLKAVDLAARNRHARCKDMLAEYHLHFCTSSSFDSVLFFGALEVTPSSSQCSGLTCDRATDTPRRAAEDREGQGVKGVRGIA
jgi:hypothetical protein